MEVERLEKEVKGCHTMKLRLEVEKHRMEMCKEEVLNRMAGNK